MNLESCESFDNKISFCPFRFTIVKADRNRIVKPNLPRTETFNGENVASLIGSGSFLYHGARANL